MTEHNKPLILVDGSSYLFRAYHALPPLTNSKGQPTGAVYGVINMIRKLVNDYDPQYIGIVFDPKGKTFRHELYKEYKANRPEMPDELRTQIQPLHDIIRAMGLPLIIVDGVEADDVIGTFTEQAKAEKIPVVISTGDKDMAQLVNSHVSLVNTMTNVMMDENGVSEKFGVKPTQIVDYLALIGDTSDNVPGVPKVGPKTAVKWLHEYGSLENIVQNAEAIKGKVGENLRASLDFLPLSQELVTIKKDVELPVELHELLRSTPDNQKLKTYFTEMEFKTWLTKLMSNADDQKTEKEYETILTEDNFLRWFEKLNQAGEFAFDTETTSLNYMEAKIVGLSFSIEPGKAAYVPLAHDYLGAPDQLNRDWVLEKLQLLLSNENNTVIGQNLKYDLGVLSNYGVEVSAAMLDTMLESYVLNGGNGANNMDALAQKHLSKITIKFEDIAGKGAKQLTFNQIDLKQASEYAAEDADITLQLHQAMYPQLKEDEKGFHVFRDIEMPLVSVLSRMERHGVLIDREKLLQQSNIIAERLGTLKEEAHQIAGVPFNLSSPKQLQEILFEKMQIPVVSKTPKGQPSTAESVLQELALNYPLPKVILEYRSLSKLKSTYTDALPQQILARTGRVHTSYNQAVTSTGRLSSTNPNLQNIPIRSEEGRRIRQAFIAPKGCKIISADYSQIELRIMAHLSQDKGLLAAFKDGHDIHRATASEVFSVALDEVSSEQRRKAKAINFGLIYGMSAFGLAKQINVERAEAQAYMDKYFERYPGILDYMTSTRELAHEKGYVQTFHGRKLYLPDINTSNQMRRMAAERAAINAPMQGTAAEIIKVAMINMQRWLDENATDIFMIMQVHDELVFEVPESNVESFVKVVDEMMSGAVTLSVPIEVSVGVGDNWDEAH